MRLPSMDDALPKAHGRPRKIPMPHCSHVASLYEFLKRKNNENRQQKIISAMEVMFP